MLNELYEQLRKPDPEDIQFEAPETMLLKQPRYRYVYKMEDIAAARSIIRYDETLQGMEHQLIGKYRVLQHIIPKLPVDIDPTDLGVHEVVVVDEDDKVHFLNCSLYQFEMRANQRSDVVDWEEIQGWLNDQ